MGNMNWSGMLNVVMYLLMMMLKEICMPLFLIGHLLHIHRTMLLQCPILVALNFLVKQVRIWYNCFFFNLYDESPCIHKLYLIADSGDELFGGCKLTSTRYCISNWLFWLLLQIVNVEIIWCFMYIQLTQMYNILTVHLLDLTVDSLYINNFFDKMILAGSKCIMLSSDV